MLAGLLLYLALRGADLAHIAATLAEADYRWLPPVVIVLLASHLLRAIRWVALMDVLEDATAARGRTGLAFSSIMIGYMVNYGAPRLGEFARTANFARLDGKPFSGVLGTVVSERILDVLMLSLCLLSVMVILSDRLLDLALHLFDGQDVTTLLILLLTGGIAVLIGLGLLLIARRMLRHSDGWLGRVTQRIEPTLRTFRDGLMSTVRAPRRMVILVTTLGMWSLYGIAAYIPFAMLGLTDAYGLGLVAAWVMMVLGSLGVVVPSPGGVGSYHYITIMGLVTLYALDPTDAASYAVLTHGAQLVLYVTMGLICLGLQALSLRRKKQRTAI